MAATSIKLGEFVEGHLVTIDLATEQPADADSTPTIDVYEEGSSTPLSAPLSVTVTNVATGHYRYSFTSSGANGFEAGKFYNVLATATVGGKTGKAVLLVLHVTAKGVDDDVTVGAIQPGAVNAAAVAGDAANKLADHALRRSFAAAAASSDGDAKSFRSLLGAVATSVNKVEIVGATLKVYEADDTTVLGTATVTINAAADPFTAIDPA